MGLGLKSPHKTCLGDSGRILFSPSLSWNSTKTLIFAPMHRLKKHLADLGDDLLSPTSDVGSSDK